MSEIELRPCPFCGSKAEIQHSHFFRVECTSVDCPAYSMNWYEYTEEEAAKRWNGEYFKEKEE